MGAFFAIIAIVFGLPICVFLFWFFVAAWTGTSIGVDKINSKRIEKAKRRLKENPNILAEEIDQELCNDMLDFFYERVRFYCIGTDKYGELDQYKLASIEAKNENRLTHNNQVSKLFKETEHTFTEKLLWGCHYMNIYWKIEENQDCILDNLVRIYQTSTPTEYGNYIKNHMATFVLQQTDDDFEKAYNDLSHAAEISSDLRMTNWHCYAGCSLYRGGPTDAPMPINNPSLGEDFYKRYGFYKTGINPPPFKTLYDIKQQTLYLVLRQMNVPNWRTYFISGGLTRADYTKEYHHLSYNPVVDSYSYQWLKQIREKQNRW